MCGTSFPVVSSMSRQLVCDIHSCSCGIATERAVLVKYSGVTEKTYLQTLGLLSDNMKIKCVSAFYSLCFIDPRGRQSFSIKKFAVQFGCVEAASKGEDLHERSVVCICLFPLAY